jgi:putative transposase
VLAPFGVFDQHQDTRRPTPFSFLQKLRYTITNGLERVNKELKRRTRVVGIFPNEAACLRLVSALAMEISEEWLAGKAYLTFAPD